MDVVNREAPTVTRHGETRARSCHACGFREVVLDPISDPNDPDTPPFRRLIGPQSHYCQRGDVLHLVHWPLVQPDGLATA